MLLHTVSKSPDNSSALASALRSALPGSCILLLEDGVFAAREGTAAASQLTAAGDIRVYALTEDVAARGLQDLLAPGIELVDYHGFVRLSVECHAVQSWY